MDEPRCHVVAPIADRHGCAFHCRQLEPIHLLEPAPTAHSGGERLPPRWMAAAWTEGGHSRAPRIRRSRPILSRSNRTISRAAAGEAAWPHHHGSARRAV
eukprot:2809788-Prymnesium_polylepis.2